MSTHWFGVPSAEGYRAAGATTFITEIAPDATTGYDFSTLEECWPGVIVSSEGAVSTVTAAHEAETHDLLQHLDIAKHVARENLM